MKNFPFALIALFALLSCSKNSVNTQEEEKFSKIRITSFTPNPKGEDDYNENFTLKNLGTKEENLSGWKILDEEGSQNIEWDVNITLAPGESYSKVSDKKAELRNTGDTIYLVNGSGAKIQTVIYDDTKDGEIIQVKE